MKEPKVPVAKEGLPFIAFSALLSMIFAVLGFVLVSLTCLTLTAFVLYFFRDPERMASDDGDALISPADGKIILIEKVFDERYVKEHVYKISIFMNIFNVHVNRVPFPGKVSKVIYTPGTFIQPTPSAVLLAMNHVRFFLSLPAAKKWLWSRSPV